MTDDKNATRDAAIEAADIAEQTADLQELFANGPIQFTMEDADGNELECTVLYAFNSAHNGKDYMVYTIGQAGDGEQEVSAAIFDPKSMKDMVDGNGGSLELQPLTTDVEWAIVADTLKQISGEDVDVNSADVLEDESVQLNVTD
ncbi:MAG: DUF1292 domain-containing protein [Eggerthellaceae bacterium]|nr:DUF1292 domain-containing protein [Eggerthellaceae bacterium]